MALQWEPIEIMFGGGLDQKKDEKSTATGKLTRAINVEFDKAGALNKRRGYAILAAVPAGVFNVNLGIRKDELVLFTYDVVYALLSATGVVYTDQTWAFRGVCPRGNVSKHVVATSRGGSDQPQAS